MARPSVEALMDSPYRTDRTPLQERRRALRQQLDEADAKLASLAAENQLRQKLAGELRALEAELRAASARRTLPLLGNVSVAAPCPAKWDDMLGDDVTRFCHQCEKSVYDLSAMTEAEAEAFLVRTFGEDVCIRFYRRADGTLLTKDCPVGGSRRRKQKIAVAAAVLGAGLAALWNARQEPVCRTAAPQVFGEKSPALDPLQPPTDQRSHTMGLRIIRPAPEK